ncbi:MAG: hypothetical protein LAQ69_36560 [Acidobacteriia bacterium]|nr:hypothetical protein [Terriglobia bacterium]
MKRMFSNCTMVLALGLAAMQTMASAQEKRDDAETPGIEGVWISNVTPINCQTGAPLAPAANVRLLYLFNHDGSVTEEPGFLPPTSGLRLSSGLGTWRHAQAQTYDAKLRLWVYNPDNSIALMAVFTKTIELSGDVFTGKGFRQDFNVNGTLVSQSCIAEIATRAQ